MSEFPFVISSLNRKRFRCPLRYANQISEPREFMVIAKSVRLGFLIFSMDSTGLATAPAGQSSEFGGQAGAHVWRATAARQVTAEADHRRQPGHVRRVPLAGTHPHRRIPVRRRAPQQPVHSHRCSLRPQVCVCSLSRLVHPRLLC